MLLERTAQVDRLTQSLAAAAGGQGCVVAVLGEAGVGKTSLVERFAREMAGRARILQGACEDLAISDPLGPLRDLARGAGWVLPRDLSPVELFSEALRVFSDRATVLVVEDLHWADDATLDWIRFLGRRARHTRILLVVTARNDSTEAQRRIRRVLADIPPDTLVRIEVPLLSLAAVAEMARETGMDPRALHRATGGNAFFVSEAILSGGVETTPAAIEDSVLLRADRLAPSAREALELVSVFPTQAEAALVAELSGGDAASGLQPCVEAGLLVEAGPFVRFRHEVSRRVVERSLGHGQRRRLNARVLAALSRDGTMPVARLVHHAREAEDYDLIHALAPSAAEAASRVGAHREAASILAATLDAPASGTSPARARLLMKLAVELYLTGRIAEAMDRLVQALALLKAAQDGTGEGDCLRWMSRLSYLAGDRIAAERYGEDALKRLAAVTDGPELAMAHSNLSQLAMLADTVGPALQHGGIAIAMARRLDRPDIVSHALNNMGAAKQWTDPESARRDLHEALDLGRRHHLQEHAARAFANLACLLVHRREHAEAASTLEEGIGYCVDRDLDTWRDYMRAWQAELLLRTGHWDEAAAAAQRVLANPEAAPLARFPACVALARLRTRRGDPAADLLQEIETFLVTGRELQRLAPYAVLLAESAWMSGAGHERARRMLEEALALMPNTSIYRDVTLWLALLDPHDSGGTVETLDVPQDMPFERAVVLSRGTRQDRQEAIALLERLQARTALARLQGVPGTGVSPAGNKAGQAGGDELTPRERTILTHLDRGLSNKAIARELGISPKTVDHHVSAILGKLAATSRAHASSVARRRGLL